MAGGDGPAGKRVLHRPGGMSGAIARASGDLERVKGIEPSYASMGSSRSTTELHPHWAPMVPPAGSALKGPARVDLLCEQIAETPPDHHRADDHEPPGTRSAQLALDSLWPNPAPVLIRA